MDLIQSAKTGIQTAVERLQYKAEPGLKTSPMSALQLLDDNYKNLEFPLGFPEFTMEAQLYTYVDKLNRALFQAIAQKSGFEGSPETVLSNWGEQGVNFQVPTVLQYSVCLHYEFKRLDGEAFPHVRIASCKIADYATKTSNDYKNWRSKPRRTDSGIERTLESKLIEAKFTPETKMKNVENVDLQSAKLRLSFPMPPAQAIAVHDEAMGDGNTLQWTSLYTTDKQILLNMQNYRALKARRWPLIPYRQNWVLIIGGEVGYATLHTDKVAEMFADKEGHFAFKFPNDEYERVFRFDCELVSPVYARAWMMGTPQKRDALKERRSQNTSGVPIEELLKDFAWNSQKAIGSSNEMIFFLRDATTTYALTETFEHEDLLNRVDRRLFRYAQNKKQIIEITATDAPAYTLVLNPGDVVGGVIKLECVVRALDVTWNLSSDGNSLLRQAVTLRHDGLITTFTPRQQTVPVDENKPWTILNITEEEYNAYLHAELYHILQTEEANFDVLKDKRGDLDPNNNFAKNLVPYDGLVAALANHGLILVNVPGDGNCQFRAVADQLSTLGITITYQKLRNQAADYIRDNNLYKVFEGPEAEPSQADYLTRMRNNREWGDAYTLLALAETHKLTIIVVQDDGSVFQVHNGDAHSITLGYYRRGHYVSTKKL